MEFREFLLTRHDGSFEAELGWIQNLMPGGGWVPAIRLRTPLVEWHGFWRFTGLNLTVAFSEDGASACALTQLLLHQNADQLATLHDSSGQAYTLQRVEPRWG